MSTKNVKSIFVSAYVSTAKSFAATVRNIYDMGQAPAPVAPAAPAVDASASAKKAYRVAKTAYDRAVDARNAALQICGSLGIDSAAIKSAGLPALRAKVMARAQYVSASGLALERRDITGDKSTALKSLANITGLYTYTIASWATVIYDAAQPGEITPAVVTVGAYYDNNGLITDPDMLKRIDATLDTAKTAAKTAKTARDAKFISELQKSIAPAVDEKSAKIDARKGAKIATK